MHNKTRDLKLVAAEIFVQEKVNSKHQNKIYRDFNSRWQFQMTPLLCIGGGEGQERWDAGQTYRMLVQREGPQEEPSFMGGAR